MRRRGYTFLELIMAAGASAILLATLVGFFARVFDANRQLSRDQMWYQDDMTAMNALSYMSRKIQRAIPSSILSSDISGAQFKFTKLIPTSDGTAFNSIAAGCVVPCDGTIGYQTENVTYSYAGGVVTEYIQGGSFPGTRRVPFTSRPSVSVTGFTFGYATQTSIPRSGSANDGYGAYVSTNVPYYSGIKLSVTLSFPDRAAKTYVKYVSMNHNVGFTRFADRPIQNSAASGAAYNLNLYSMGGYRAGPVYLPDIHRWNFSTNSWTTNPAGMGTLPAGNRCCSGAASMQKGNVNDRIYVAGGYNGATYLNYFDYWNNFGSFWTITNNLSIGRTNTSAVWSGATGCDGRVYSLGGYNSGAGNVKNVDVFDVCTGVYSRADIPAGLTAPGSNPILVADGSYIYAFGGTNATTQVLRMNVWTNAWVLWAWLPYGIYDGTAAQMSGFIYLMGNGTIGDRILCFEPVAGVTNMVMANRPDTGAAVGAEVEPYYNKLYYVQDTSKSMFGIELVPPYP